jgi:hypothetical protein
MLPALSETRVRTHMYGILVAHHMHGRLITHTPLSVLVKVLDLQPCDANSLKLLGCNSMKIRFSGTKINITAISQYVNRYLLASIFCSPQQAFLSIFVKEIVSLSKYSANNIPRALFALHKLK